MFFRSNSEYLMLLGPITETFSMFFLLLNMVQGCQEFVPLLRHLTSPKRIDPMQSSLLLAFVYQFAASLTIVEHRQPTNPYQAQYETDHQSLSLADLHELDADCGRRPPKAGPS